MSEKKKPQVPAVCHGHSRPIVQVNYSPVTPDGYFLVSASKDGQPMLRDGATGNWIGTFLGHKGAVWSCVLNDPATLAVTGSADFTAKVWDALSGDEKHTFPHKHIVRTVNFAHTSSRFITGGMEKLIRVYDLERPDAEPSVIQGSPSGLRCTAVSADDTLLLTSTLDHPGITVWDLRTHKSIRQLETDAPVASIELSPCGRFVTSTDGSSVKFWDAGSQSLLRQHTLPYTVESASFCPSKGKFVAGGNDMWVHLYSYETGKELETNKGHHGPVHTVRFGPAGKEYASGSEDGTIRIWQTDYLLDKGNGGAPLNGATNGGA